jgi:hypothetical protein
MPGHCIRREVVHAEHRIARKAVEKAVCNHRRGAAKPLLGGLKDQMHCTVEIARFRKITGSA